MPCQEDKLVYTNDKVTVSNYDLLKISKPGTIMDKVDDHTHASPCQKDKFIYKSKQDRYSGGWIFTYLIFFFFFGQDIVEFYNWLLVADYRNGAIVLCNKDGSWFFLKILWSRHRRVL